MMLNANITADTGDNSILSLDMIAPSCQGSPATVDETVNVALVNTPSTAHTSCTIAPC